MSFTLADILSPTPQMPKTAGSIVAAPEAGEGSAFADALKAFRAAAGTAGEAGVAIAIPEEGGAAAPELPPRAQAETVIGLEAALLPTIPSQAADPDAPVVETPPPAGAPVSETGDVATAPVVPDEAPQAEDTTDPNLIIAAPISPVVTPPPVVTGATAEEIALKIAAAAGSPEDLPASSQPEMPLMPATSGADAAPDTAPLLEGRASAAVAPPSAPPVLNTGDVVPELPKDVIEALAPRAQAAGQAINSEASTPAAVPPQSAAASQSAPIPAALQAIAAEPDVVSVQAKAVADTDADEDGETAPAVTTPAPRGAERAAASTTPSVPAPATAAEPLAAEPVLVADPETKAKAADGALAVLTEKKTDTTAAPAKPAPVAETDPAAKPGAVARAPANDSAVDVKTPDPKEALTDKVTQEKPAAERPAPAAADKPAPQNDVRAPQSPMPVNDKPVAAELAAKTVQQQSQNLPATAIPQIAGEIVSKVKRGATRFEIRLDPPELGRIDVRIDVDKDGRVTSRLMVEKTETLDLLKADQRALERALHDAGFKADQGSLSFSLKDQRDGQAKFDEQRQLHQSSDSAATEEEPVRHVAETAYRAAMRGPGGFDLRV